MAATLPKSFWPDDIKLENVLSPVVILRQAAGQLSKLTGNLLEGRVTTIREVEDGDWWLAHTLDVVAPALDRYSRTILRARHEEMLVYPVHVNDGFDWRPCSSEEEFVQTVAGILGSPPTRSLLYGLGARINEQSSQADDATSAS